MNLIESCRREKYVELLQILYTLLKWNTVHMSDISSVELKLQPCEFGRRSLGVIFHILLTGQFPFSTSEDAIFKVRLGWVHHSLASFRRNVPFHPKFHHLPLMSYWDLMGTPTRWWFGMIWMQEMSERGILQKDLEAMDGPAAQPLLFAVVPLDPPEVAKICPDPLGKT